MDLLLKNKTVIVTGASAGIGRAIAEEYAREGAHVFISSRNEEKLQKVQKEMAEITKNEHVYYAVCDVSKKQDIEQLIKTVIEKSGAIDVLINNAGGPPAGLFMDMGEETWSKAIEQNLLSVIRTTKLVIPFMKKRGEGRIVNITSSSMKQSIDQLVLSNTIRPGVLGLTKTLARELATDRILVNAVGPGKIATDRISELNMKTAETKGISLDEVIEETVSDIPLGRLGKPEEFAKAVVFLGSFANTYITGQSLIVDGASVQSL